jgi:hypothetical protein
MNEHMAWVTDELNAGRVPDSVMVCRAILRAALPWDLPVERLEVMVAGLLEVIDYPEQDGPPTLLEMRQNILAAYRADPIMRELYPEKY